MTENLTPQASTALESYLDEVRAILRGAGVDVEEVVEDIRDHVHEATAGAGSPLSRGEIDEVLDALGAPSRWLEGDPPPSPEARDAGIRWTRRWLPVAVFLLTLLGLAAFPWVGPLGVLAAWLAARAAARTRLTDPQKWLVYPAAVIAAAGLSLLLLVLPSPPLFELGGRAPSTARAWATVLGGLGVWWAAMGLVVRSLARPFAWVLYPLPIRPRVGTALSVAGALLMISAVALAVAA